MTYRASLAALPLVLAAACSSGAVQPGHDAGDDDASDASDAADAADKSAPCAATFGAALTDAFGRFDGTVLAVVPPDNHTCAEPNGTHLVLQVTWAGTAYRMVLDILSSAVDPNVFFDEIDAPLAAGPWAEGWHPGVALDYPTTLGVHAGAFVSMTEDDLVEKVTSEIVLGDPISVFATSAGEPDSAHLIHRNINSTDGAIVLAPDSASPHWLLFRFSNQSAF